ncbi:hypothetical protein BDQ17DRAFT_41261 [Cyathus striatus]|nr:hypothetical protein BDQ17DRAFT_41261 [Cyathus striatus]
MARATRSSAVGEHDLQAQKKRKRNDSPPPHDAALPAKLQRTHSATHPAYLPQHHASKILAVLRRTDTQGLLDRVFPLPADLASPHSSSSLSSLLQHPAQHPFSVIKDAILHLRPISSLPRSRVSPTAAQQLRFCNLALDLLHQASCNSLSIPLDTESILSSPQPSSPSPSSPKSPSRSPARKYALVQHLPSGDYWSSTNSDPSTPDLSRRITDLSTAHAELAVVLPSPSSSFSPSSIPTLASYHTRSLGPTKTLPTQRQLTTAKFLDYGPWSSFAPAFDHDMELVGRRDLGLILFHKELRRREYFAARREALEGSGYIVQVNGADVVDDAPPSSIDPSLATAAANNEQSEPDLHSLLSDDDAASFKSALGNLELENAVQKLLDKNHRALIRLEELQFKRLSKEGGDASVAEGSEEWETAQNILESLTVLSSLRPRTASAEPSTIFPPPSVLRKLHRSLALEPSSGWHGTLPPARAVALRDDSTVKVRSTPTPAGASVASPPPDTSSTTTPAPVTQPYAVYPYTYTPGQPQAGTPYRAPSVTATPYTTYKPGQTGSFYQGYVTPAGQQHSSYYGQQSYTGAAAAAASGAQSYMATNQQPYAAYSNWYTQYPAQVAAASAAAASGRGTPQPVSAYASFFSGTGGTATPPPTAPRTPAVANTVAVNKVVPQQATATWQYGQAAQQSSVATPTLPSHLKNAQQGSALQAYSPSATTAPVAQQQYYGQYQAQPSTPATPAAR